MGSVSGCITEGGDAGGDFSKLSEGRLTDREHLKEGHEGSGDRNRTVVELFFEIGEKVAEGHRDGSGGSHAAKNLNVEENAVRESGEDRRPEGSLGGPVSVDRHDVVHFEDGSEEHDRTGHVGAGMGDADLNRYVVVESLKHIHEDRGRLGEIAGGLAFLVGARIVLGVGEAVFGFGVEVAESERVFLFGFVVHGLVLRGGRVRKNNSVEIYSCGSIS